MTARLKECIAPSYSEAHKAIKRNDFIHYWFKGGRGSTKSSFISIEIVLDTIKDPISNSVCFRKVGQTLQDSCYAQILWAIDKLEVTDFFKAYKSPHRIVYRPTGQMILFKGMDDPRKMKSVKLRKGYLKNAWYEELDEFDGMEEIRKVNQSIIRGAESFRIYYSYNPPQNTNSWVNTEVQVKNPRRYCHHSTYLDVPRTWLGEMFYLEAEHLQKTNELAYRHEYLGEATGTGGTIFPNVKIETISDEQISHFDKLRQGLDWGYAVDPFAFVKMHYDKTRKRLYIFDEIYKTNMLNDVAMKKVKEKANKNTVITADNEEPKSIAEFRANQINIIGADKGKDSVRFGIKFLQRLEAIIIDSERCPNAANEFLKYELEKKKDGTWIDEYPDKNNHTIDSVRYAMEKDAMQKVSILEVLGVKK